MKFTHIPRRIALSILLLLGVAITSSRGNATTSTNSTNIAPPIAIIPNAIVPWNGKSTTINIGKYFPAPLVPTNASVTLPSNSVYVNTSLGDFWIQLFPTNAPVTTANFLRYVTNGLYNGMTIHRSVPGFVIQTGGYDINTSLSYNAINSFGTITNEFGLSNVRGTVAMALVGTNPNSATSEWFINLADNSSILDKTNTASNPPFAVFGQVLGINGNASNNMETPDAIQSLPTAKTLNLFLSSPFDELPLNNWNSNSVLAYSHLVIVANMGTIPFAACTDTNTFSIALQGTNLAITPHAQSTGPATLYIHTVDTNGQVLSKSFQISTRKFYQTINFTAFNYTTYSTNLYQLSNLPTVSSGPSFAASGLPVSISVASGPAIMTNVVTNGVTNRMIQLKGAGWVQLTAKQAGNLFYNAAPPATGWLHVYPAIQTITFPPISSLSNIATPYSLDLTTNYPKVSSGLPVKVTVSGPAKLSKTSLLITNSGTLTVIASQNGNANYYAAVPVTNSFSVSATNSVISK